MEVGLHRLPCSCRALHSSDTFGRQATTFRGGLFRWDPANDKIPTVRSPKWSEFSATLAYEQLPDGVIEDTDIDDWQSVLDLAQTSGWRVGSHDGTSGRSMSARRLLGDEELHTVALWPQPNVQINLFLNNESEVLFDFDTREIDDQKSLDTLCEFIRAIGRTVGKPVAVTHEGSRLLLLRYAPVPTGSLWKMTLSRSEVGRQPNRWPLRVCGLTHTLTA